MRVNDSVTRRRVLQGLGALVAPALVRTVVRAAQQRADQVPYSPSMLPAGIRSRSVLGPHGTVLAIPLDADRRQITNESKD